MAAEHGSIRNRGKNKGPPFKKNTACGNHYAKKQFTNKAPITQGSNSLISECNEITVGL